MIITLCSDDKVLEYSEIDFANGNVEFQSHQFVAVAVLS